MWSDNEADKDFLNFQVVADTIAEMIVQSSGNPLSVGVSGGWGVGKTTMLGLIRRALDSRGDDKFLFVDFNAWLYQGFDDARAALMDCIARALLSRAEEKKTCIDKVRELLGRIDWIRAAKAIAAPAASLALGLPVAGVAGQALWAMGRLARGAGTGQDVETVDEAAEKAGGVARSLLKPKQDDTPPKEVQDLREHFEETLHELDVSLVVFIDDLDRCLPDTAIGTLEAVRLFLFLKNTAFVIAADDNMIRYAVRVHFGNRPMDDDLVTNYFDKLIQVPIRVPMLGTQDVRAYMLLLFIDDSDLPAAKKDEVREAICRQLGLSWQGKRVDRDFAASLIKDCPPELLARFDMADRLAPIMTTAGKISGNPRLIKRFLNTLAIRMSIAQAQGVSVDETVLAKLLLFERCASEAAFAELISAVNSDEDGKPRLLKPLEETVAAGQKLDELPSAAWDGSFMREWLALPPALSARDLRPEVFVSRDYVRLVTPSEQLSAEAARLLPALLAMRRPSPALEAEVKRLPKHELGAIMDRLLNAARQVQDWTRPGVLRACLVVVAADPGQANRVVAFLSQIPPQQLGPALIPLLESEAWVRPVLDRWRSDPSTPGRVRKAIAGTSGKSG